MRSHPFIQIALAGAVTLAVSGCASSEKNTEIQADDEAVVEQTATRETDKPLRTNRELTLSYDNIGRAGAAVHRPAYVHVLGDRHDWAEINAPHGAEIDKAKINNAANTKGSTSKPGQALSFYELQRWERFCDNGKGMDERDWRFVESQQYSPPMDVLGVCQAPSFDYSKYLEAWTRFCNGSEQYDAHDKAIVRNSSRPFSRVNPCKALSAGQG